MAFRLAYLMLARMLRRSGSVGANASCGGPEPMPIRVAAHASRAPNRHCGGGPGPKG
jgi:hypothetical protein